MKEYASFWFRSGASPRSYSSWATDAISSFAKVHPDTTFLTNLLQHGNPLVINPLLTDNTWDYFCLDRVPCHGKTLTILYDKTGTKYGRGIGLRVFVNGIEKASSPSL